MAPPSSLLAIALPLFLGVGCGGGGGAGGPDPGPRNVILICLDTVRADHLGCYGYERNPTTPALDALAARSTLFRDTSAASGWTKPSVPSFLTGTWPAAHGVYEGSSDDEGGATSDVLPERAFTLAEAFAERGYRSAAFVKNAQLRHGQGIEQGFELYVEPAGDMRAIRWQALDWLDAREGEAPFFLYLHALDAHWPYPVPEAYARRFHDGPELDLFRSDDWKELRDRINDGELELEPAQREAMIDLYDGALRYLDDQLAQLLEGLALRGLAEDTVVCVISDHGEEFLEHGRIGHGHGLYETLLQVPWILHVPGREARVVETPVSLVDLFPTLLAAAGPGRIPPSEGVDRLAEPTLERASFAEHKSSRTYLQAVRSGERKLERRFRRDEGAPVAERSTAELLAAAFGRFQVEYEPDGSGRLVATQLEPDEDDLGEPVELKGLITAWEPERFAIDGVWIARAPGFEPYGELTDADGDAVSPAPGLLVKAKLLEGPGGPSCERLKLYAADAEPEHELRGPLSEVASEAGALQLSVGPVRLTLADDAELELPGADPRRITREEILGLLAATPDERADSGLQVERWLYELARDPGEERRLEEHPALEPLSELLDRWGLLQSESAYWGADDRSRLTADELEALRAIGYTE